VEQSLEGEVKETWRCQATDSSESLTNDERARAADEAETAARKWMSLFGEPWTWLWDEISPQGRERMKPSRT
jgi:hypothetical protein